MKITLKTKNELRAIPADIESVAEWLNCNLEDLRFYYEEVPLAKLEKQIVEMQESYEEFPQDRKRTDKILKILKSGGKAYPIFIEKDDPHLFVMEGRHRMVAFYELGYKKLPVYFVSKNE